MKKILYVLILLQLCSCIGIHDKKTEETTPAITVTGEKEIEIRKLFNLARTNSAEDSLVSFTILKEEITEDEMYDLHSEKDTNNNIIKVEFRHQKGATETTIEMSGYMKFYNEKLLTDANDSIGIILWISEPFYRAKMGDMNINHKYELRLKVLDFNSDKALYDNVIYSTKCCIDRLSMILNPFTNSVLVSYNDFSKSDSRYLMYGYVDIENGTVNEKGFNPREVILQDRSEKRWPKFLKSSNGVYLYHTSGDRWGAFAHSGKKQVGISTVNEKNNLVNYRVITDSLPINENLIIIEDTVYYRTENSRAYSEMLIKKVNVEDILKYK